MKRDPILDDLQNRPKEKLSSSNRREMLHELKKEEEQLEKNTVKRRRSWLPPGKGLTYAATILLFPLIGYVMWMLLEETSDTDETLFFQGEQVNITAPEDPDETALMLHFEQADAGTYVLEGSPDELVAELISEDKDISGIERFGVIEGSHYDFYGYYYVDDHRRLNLVGAVTIDAGAEDEQYLLEVYSIQIDESTLREQYAGETEMMTYINSGHRGSGTHFFSFGLGFSPEANIESINVDNLEELETLIAEDQLMMFGLGETLERFLEIVGDDSGPLDMYADRLDVNLCLDDGNCYEREFIRHPLLPDY